MALARPFGSCLLALILALCCGKVFPQEKSGNAYMIPPKIFVGDRATLIVPLPGFSVQTDSEISPEQLPSQYGIDIHRVVLERRPNGSQLAIEFSAFMPGTLELPPIDIAGRLFSGLHVEISSILETGDSRLVLSGPTSPLAIPGTSILVYGSIFATVFSLLFVLWALLWGRKRLKEWLAMLEQRRLLLSMWAILKRLRKDLTKGVPQREVLDSLSFELRGFLSYFSGQNCRSMTAFEFGSTVLFEDYPNVPGREFLAKLFGRCDCARFSGEKIGKNEAEDLLTEARYFLKSLDRNMRKNARQKNLRASKPQAENQGNEGEAA